MDTVKRPKGSHEESFALVQVCRNLITDLDSEDKENQNLKVFLRLKANDNYPEDCYAVNTNKIITRAPKTSNAFKSSCGNVNSIKSTFTFTKIFRGDSTQQDIFEEVAQEPIRDFLSGKNSLIFSYGTTSSGKTYTIQGNTKNLGMVPRTFDALFNSVNLVNEKSCLLKPYEYCSVNQMTLDENEALLKDKRTLLKQAASLSEDNLASLISSGDESDIKMLMNMVTQSGHRDQASSKLSLETAQTANSCYSFWVSFSEIYNENVYDLLDVSNYAKVTSKNAPLKRKKLDLRMDKHGAIFMKNLTQVPVISSDEAYSLLLLGKSIQHVASTRLNQSSSRSHTVFSITAVRHINAGGDFDPQNCLFNNSDSIRVSTLNFCDLAGSERTKKAHTEAAGSRFKESTNINASLLTLGRCIEIMRFNQLHPNKLKVVPYRESKLTRLFQTFFTGRGRARMIVNVSQDPNLFDESQQTLRFSALAQEVNIPDEILRPATGRLSRYHRLGLLTPGPGERVSIDWETVRNSTIAQSSDSVGDLDKTLEETQSFSKEEYEEIIHSLREEVMTLKKSMEDQDWEIRQEVCQDFEKHIQELEDQNEEQMRDYKQNVEEEYEKRLQLYLEAYSSLQPKKRKIAVKSADHTEVISQASSSHDADIVKQLTDDLKSSNEKNRDLERQLAEEKETSNYLAKRIDELETETNRLHYNVKELSEIRNVSHSQPVSGTPKSNTSLNHSGDSCVNSSTPVTVLKKKFFDESVSVFSNQSRRIEELEKSVLDTDRLRIENHKLLEKMNTLQEQLHGAMKMKEAFELETSQLKIELESKLGRSSTVDMSFLKHERDTEYEDESCKVTQLELRNRELEAQLVGSSKTISDLNKELQRLSEDIGRTRLVSANELTNKRDEINDLQNLTRGKEHKIETLMQEKGNLELEINSLTRKLSDFTKDSELLKKTLNNKQEELKDCKSQLGYMKTINSQIKSTEEGLRSETMLLGNKVEEGELKLKKVCNELHEKTQLALKDRKTIRDAHSKEYNDAEIESDKIKILSLELKLSQSVDEIASLKKKISELERNTEIQRNSSSTYNSMNDCEDSNDSQPPTQNYDSFINDDEEFREPLPPKRKTSRKTKLALNDSSSSEKSRVLRSTRSTRSSRK